METWKTENLEKWTFGKIQIWKNGKFENRNKEKWKFVKMDICKNGNL